MRADSFYLSTFRDSLLADFQSLRIFDEFDMQCCAYFAVRKHFDSERASVWTVRAQPTVVGRAGVTRKPDLGVFRGKKLVDVLELKFLVNSPAALSRHAEDLKKLRDFRDDYTGIRHVYQVTMHDTDDLRPLPKADWMKSFYTEVAINVSRRTTGTMRPDWENEIENWKWTKALMKEQESR